MNRDMDAIRKIVLAVRDAPAEVTSVNEMPEDVFRFNAMLLIEAGLVDGIFNKSGGRHFTPVPSAVILWRLTWDGFDFADSISNDALWNKAKERVIKPAGSWTFDILRDVLAALIKEGLKL